MKIIASLLFLAFSSLLISQGDSTRVIKVHFLYGSKPKRQFKATEPKYFGGIHGGHVTIELDGHIMGFSPKNKFHIVAHRKNRHSVFDDKKLNDWAKDTVTRKYTSIEIPINQQQYKELKNTTQQYITNTPYDYAFIGMRCAACTRHILGDIGIFKKRSRFATILTTFYPKPLRKKILKKAKENKYNIHRQPGRVSRKWEKD